MVKTMMWLLSLVASCRLLRCRVSTRSLESTVHGLFVPWTIRTLDYSYHRWTIRTLDCSYCGLFIPSWTVGTFLGFFVPWTVRTVDCSYPLGLPYHGLVVPSLDFSYPGLFAPQTNRTLLDCSYYGLLVDWWNSPWYEQSRRVRTVHGTNSQR